MISIIIPVFNQAKKISACLESIIKQTINNTSNSIEIIIVNDGSKDGVENVLGNFIKTHDFDFEIKVFNQVNQGAPAARNRGAKEARGEYLFFCDADAILRANALEEMMSALTLNPTVGYAYSSFLWGRKLFKIGPFDAEKLKREPYIHTMSLIRREIFPGWDESIKKFQDWDLWLTVLESGYTGIWIDKVLFTVSPGGTISSWLPSFAYKYLPFLPQVKKYRQAMAIIKKKHRL